MKPVRPADFDRDDMPVAATPLCSVARHRLVGNFNEDARQQRRFELICARELLGDLD